MSGSPADLKTVHLVHNSFTKKVLGHVLFLRGPKAKNEISVLTLRLDSLLSDRYIKRFAMFVFYNNQMFIHVCLLAGNAG